MNGGRKALWQCLVMPKSGLAPGTPTGRKAALTIILDYQEMETRSAFDSDISINYFPLISPPLLFVLSAGQSENPLAVQARFARLGIAFSGETYHNRIGDIPIFTVPLAGLHPLKAR